MNCHFRSLFHQSLPSVLASLVAVTAVEVRPLLAESPSAGDAALFERLDADGNQKISAKEVSQDHERLFARLLRRGDADDDKALSRDEFFAALVPTRPEKPIEEKQPATFPQAEAVRYVLLSMDTSRDGWIDADEVPEDLQPVLDVMLERLDTNDNDALDRFELSRGSGALGQIAGRYVARDRIDVASELKKLEKSQGKAASRFDEQRPAVEMFRDPGQARALFARLDGNGDGQIEAGEVPEPFQPQLERFMRVGDRDRDGKLSQREFLSGAERISRFLRRQRPARGEMPDRDAMPAESMPAENP